VPLALIGAGPNGGNLDWTRRFFAKARKNGSLGRLWGWGLHHYAWNASGGRTTDWMKGKGDAVKFTPEQYYEILREADDMERLITEHWAAMAESDPRHNTKLAVDEWGAWHAPGTEPFPEALLGQQNTMRDAVLAGLTLDTFQRHPEKVAMGCIAQLVNCLHSLFLAHEDKFCVTPTYHVFDMYAAHGGARQIRAVFSAPAIQYTRNNAPATMRGLNGSASLRNGQLTLTVTNPSLDRPQQAEILVRGGTPKSVSGVTLASADAGAFNSFENPEAVAPRQIKAVLNGAALVCEFPPASVTKFTMGIG
jgi:alpha-N-arabinofuranosidase